MIWRVLLLWLLALSSQRAMASLTAPATGADPVDLADGTFQVEHMDLSLGQAEPLGISLSRYYNGTRRYSNPAGMAPGWIHNYCVSASAVSAPQLALGGGTPAQAAAMICATCAALNLYDDLNVDPKNWMVTALIAKWGVDQLTKNSVAVLLGKDTLQFVKQPDGVFTPPPDCTASLTQAGSAYSLLLRHGNTFNFDTSGRLGTIVDQYANTLTVSYLSSASSLPSQVTDAKGRALTFTYNNGSSNQLMSVSDGTRTVYYGYTNVYSTQGDLASFTDADGNSTSYLYDTNHQITATIDARQRLVVSNLYDTQGHVTTQYTEGQTSKTWNIAWTGWQTVLLDPAGGQQTYFYDDAGRETAQQDALGNLRQTVYDGQNHVVQTVSPLNETNRFIYDGNHNMTNAVDPLGYTSRYVYDSLNNLIATFDPLGHSNTFGYNAEFSLIGQTNGAGDWVNYVYNTTGSPGTLASRADSGGTTAYSYDSTYGQLIGLTYPNSLGGESFVNNAFGDVTSHTDANGNITTFTYNNRRELTKSTGPTNVINSIGYDAVGNVISATDARANTTSNTWSASRYLLTTTLPPTPQGVPVITNSYDNRDWLIGTADPLNNPTHYTNDSDGRLLATTDPVLRTTTVNYDADGHTLATINAGNETNRQTWDARGSLIRLTDGAGHFSTRVYDGAGNQTTLTNRNTNTWQFQFDTANRLVSTITPTGHVSSVTFNHQGLVASSTNMAGQATTYFYDAKGRLTNRVDALAATAYGHDADDNLTGVTENGLSASWTYDAYDRVATYVDVNGYGITNRYDANGNVTNLVYPGGRTVIYAYDSLNRLTNVTDWASRKTSFTYDLAGHLTTVTRPNGSFRTIGYDAAGQVTNIWEQMANSLPIAWFRLCWTNSGNLLWEFAAPLPHTNSPSLRTMTYDVDNRLVSVNGTNVVSDSDGNLTYGPLHVGPFTNYTYDVRDRLSNAGGVTNFYDAINNRLGQNYGTNTTTYVVNPTTKLPQVLMRVKNGVTTYYIYGAGLLYQITETATATNTLTYHYDYRGSTIALSADNGLVTDRVEYSLYGSTTYRAGTNDTPFLFNGRYGVQTDPNGLLYMQARYYNPYLCRFINADPSGFAGGLNFYAYANGNPVSKSDPFGLEAQGENAAASSGFLSGDNSVPYMVGTINPNVNTGPFLTAQGSTAPLPQPYLDPSQPATMSWSSPTDVAFQQNIQGALQAASTTLSVLSMLTPEGDLAAVEETTTVNVLESSGKTFVVDTRGNVIPLEQGETLSGSPNGQWLQVRDADGNPTGMRLDGGHNPASHPDPSAQIPHAHVPGVVNPNGTPWLPVN